MRENRNALNVYKDLRAYELASEVIGVYESFRKNNSAKESKPTLFFRALDTVRANHHYHDQKIKHDWYKKDLFYRDIIFWCHQIHPRKNFIRINEIAEQNKMQYQKDVLDEIEHIVLLHTFDFPSVSEVLEFAIQETWNREFESVERALLWSSCEEFRQFVLGSFPRTSQALF